MAANLIYDSKLRPIEVGDVLKVFHFVGSRRKKYYMYKLVVEVDGKLRGFDVTQIATKGMSNAHNYLLSFADGRVLEHVEIVQGYGLDGVSYENRPKLRAQQVEVRGEG